MTPKESQEALKKLKEVCAAMYLDWVNNFLGREAFCSYYGLTMDEAITVINIGRKEREKVWNERPTAMGKGR